MQPVDKLTSQSHNSIQVHDGTILVAGEEVEYFVLPHNDYDESWLKRQFNSLEEYEQTHVESIADDHNNRLCSLFGSYLSSAVLSIAADKQNFRTLNVLDVGCGIYDDPPPYMRNQLTDIVNYFGLDPLDVNHDSRSYSFFLGDLTQLASQANLRSAFDVIIFATSLDHIDNLERTVDEVRTLASPGAVAIFWCGVHDPEIVGEHNGSLVFRELLSHGSVAGYVRFFLYGIVRLPRLLARTALTRYRLQHGIPLDDLHERYFTVETLEDAMESFGQVVSSVRVPGSNSVYHCVAVHGSPSG